MASTPANVVYGPRDPNFAVQCIYFYYATETNDPKYEVQAYYIDRGVDITDIEAEARSLLDDAKAGRITPCGWKFGDLRWRRKSYLVFVLDSPAHRLFPSDAVVFQGSTSLRGGNDILAFPSHPDASGFYCENHMTFWPGLAETVRVYLNHPGHLAHVIASQFNHQDSGTNMGPPIPPP